MLQVPSPISAAKPRLPRVDDASIGRRRSACRARLPLLQSMPVLLGRREHARHCLYSLSRTAPRPFLCLLHLTEQTQRTPPPPPPFLARELLPCETSRHRPPPPIHSDPELPLGDTKPPRSSLVKSEPPPSRASSSPTRHRACRRPPPPLRRPHHGAPPSEHPRRRATSR